MVELEVDDALASAANTCGVRPSTSFVVDDFALNVQ